MNRAKSFGTSNLLDDHDDDSDDDREVSLTQLQDLFSSSLVSPASLEQRVPTADSDLDYADVKTLKKAVDRFYHPKIVRALDSGTFQYSRFGIVSWTDFLALASDYLPAVERSYIEENSVAYDDDLPASLRPKSTFNAGGAGSTRSSAAAVVNAKDESFDNSNDFDDDDEDHSIEEIPSKYNNNTNNNNNKPTWGQTTSNTNNNNNTNAGRGKGSSILDPSFNSFDQSSAVLEDDEDDEDRRYPSQKRRGDESSFMSIPQLSDEPPERDNKPRVDNRNATVGIAASGAGGGGGVRGMLSTWQNDSASEVESVAMHDSREGDMSQVYSSQQSDGSYLDESSIPNLSQLYVPPPVKDTRPDPPPRTQPTSQQQPQTQNQSQPQPSSRSQQILQSLQSDDDDSEEDEFGDRKPPPIRASAEPDISPPESRAQSVSVPGPVPQAKPDPPIDQQTVVSRTQPAKPAKPSMFSLTAVDQSGASEADSLSVVSSSSPQRPTRGSVESLALPPIEDEEPEPDLRRSVAPSVMESVSLDSPVKTKMAPAATDNANPSTAAKPEPSRSIFSALRRPSVDKSQSAAMSTPNAAPQAQASPSASSSATNIFAKVKQAFNISSALRSRSNERGTGSSGAGSGVAGAGVGRDRSGSRDSALSSTDSVAADISRSNPPTMKALLDDSSSTTSDVAAEKPRSRLTRLDSNEFRHSLQKQQSAGSNGPISPGRSTTPPQPLPEPQQTQAQQPQPQPQPMTQSQPQPAPMQPVAKEAPQTVSKSLPTPKPAPVVERESPEDSVASLNTSALTPATFSSSSKPRLSNPALSMRRSQSQPIPTPGPLSLSYQQTDSQQTSFEEPRKMAPSLRSASMKATTASSVDGSVSGGKAPLPTSMSQSFSAPAPIDTQLPTPQPIRRESNSPISSSSAAPKLPQPGPSATISTDSWKAVLRTTTTKMPQDGRGLAARLRHIQYGQSFSAPVRDSQQIGSSLQQLKVLKTRQDQKLLNGGSKALTPGQLQSMSKSNKLQELMARSKKLSAQVDDAMTPKMKRELSRLTEQPVFGSKPNLVKVDIESELDLITKRFEEEEERQRLLQQNVLEEVTVYDSHFPRKTVVSRRNNRTSDLSASMDSRCVEAIDVLLQRREPVSIFLTPANFEEMRKLSTRADSDRIEDRKTLEAVREGRPGSLLQSLRTKFKIVHVEEKRESANDSETSTSEGKAEKEKLTNPAVSLPITKAKASKQSLLHDDDFYRLPNPTFTHTYNVAKFLPDETSFDRSAGIAFAGHLKCRKRNINRFRDRFIQLLWHPLANPNLMSDFSSIKGSPSTVDSASDGYYLAEYKSCIASSWGSLPLGFKRCYSIDRQLVGIVTKSKAAYRGLVFTLYFASTDDLVAFIEEDVVRNVSNGMSRSTAANTGGRRAPVKFDSDDEQSNIDPDDDMNHSDDEDDDGKKDKESDSEDEEQKEDEKKEDEKDDNQKAETKDAKDDTGAATTSNASLDEKKDEENEEKDEEGKKVVEKAEEKEEEKSTSTPPNSTTLAAPDALSTTAAPPTPVPVPAPMTKSKSKRDVNALDVQSVGRMSTSTIAPDVPTPTVTPMPQPVVESAPKVTKAPSKFSGKLAMQTVFQDRWIAAFERAKEIIGAFMTALNIDGPVVLVDGESEHIVYPINKDDAVQIFGSYRNGSLLTDLLVNKKVRRFKIRNDAVRVTSVGMKASNTDERLKWTRIIQSLAPKDVYVNTVNF